MIMVRAIVRPEKSAAVLQALLDAGYPAVTKMDVAGRGKQRGLKVGNVTYDELPKEMLMAVVHESDKDLLLRAVMEAARTGEKGAFGDGKIFVSPVSEVYTISSGAMEAGDRP
ncbi:MAG: P-II family nitrogen regulator [Deltaproteobacteria bacterium]|nr:P-II family nitrogen regulator [Deltaproteobacteria bacterium]